MWYEIVFSVVDAPGGDGFLGELVDRAKVLERVVFTTLSVATLIMRKPSGPTGRANSQILRRSSIARLGKRVNCSSSFASDTATISACSKELILSAVVSSMTYFEGEDVKVVVLKCCEDKKAIVYFGPD